LIGGGAERTVLRRVAAERVIAEGQRLHRAARGEGRAVRIRELGRRKSHPARVGMGQPHSVRGGYVCILSWAEEQFCRGRAPKEQERKWSGS
jgi:hypothetical protein